MRRVISIVALALFVSVGVNATTAATHSRADGCVPRPVANSARDDLLRRMSEMSVNRSSRAEMLALGQSRSGAVKWSTAAATAAALPRGMLWVPVTG